MWVFYYRCFLVEDNIDNQANQTVFEWCLMHSLYRCRFFYDLIWIVHMGPEYLQ